MSDMPTSVAVIHFFVVICGLLCGLTIIYVAMNLVAAGIYHFLPNTKAGKWIAEEFYQDEALKPLNPKVGDCLRPRKNDTQTQAGK